MRRIKSSGSFVKVALMAAVLVGFSAADSRLGAQQNVGGSDDAVQLAQAEGAKRKPSAANSFNRLLKKPSSGLNAKPAQDGIHDASNPGTHSLQWPSEAFQDLPKAGDGNKVDWVKALNSGAIAPWVDLEDPDAEAFTMDLTIVREVKGSMPNVVFPHFTHTQWLDCTNCHDDIFIPEKGKNQISMAAILLGQKCGICHGTVAFPVTDCRRCHAQPKTPEQLKEMANQSQWRGGGAKPPSAAKDGAAEGPKTN